MRIPTGSTDRFLAFVALDATDRVTRETGLSAFTVFRSRDGGTATAMTTPTVNELSAANMPGDYVLLLDEDTTIDAGHDTEQLTLHITQASMAPVTIVVELYRPETTEGSTLTVTTGGALSTIATDAVNADALATDAVTEIADGLLDLVNGIETSLTLRQAARVALAALAGKASGMATTTAVFRNAQADTKNRITATVDADGNRSAVTLDAT